MRAKIQPIPAERRAAAKELLRQGATYEEVTAKTGVARSSCTHLRKEVEAEAAAKVVFASTAALPSPTLPDLDEQGLGDDFAALAADERVVTGLLQAALGAGNVAQAERLARMRIALREAMARLRPAPPLDPEVDPANLEAARVLRGKLRTMVHRLRAARGAAA